MPIRTKKHLALEIFLAIRALATLAFVVCVGGLVAGGWGLMPVAICAVILMISGAAEGLLNE